MSVLDRLKQAVAMVFSAEVAKTSHWNNIAKAAQRTETLCNRFVDKPLAPPGSACLASYQEFVDHLIFRMHLPVSRFARFAPIVRRLSQYFKFAGVGSPIKDILARRS
jgi:hypothetical protein